MQSEFSIIILNHAKQDLEDIFSYIGNTLSNEKAVDDLYKSFYSAFESIRLFPFASSKSKFQFDGITLYKKTVKNYLVFYMVDQASCKIHLVRILYAARNLHDIL